jgi:putative component of toxin-antitoxin plasmid stabilization module
MRIFSGPCYRIYYRQHGDVVTFLYGGHKDSEKP